MGIASASYTSGRRILREYLLGIDEPPANPNAMNDEFDGSSLDTSKWTWLDQGDATAHIVDSTLEIRLDENSNRMRGIYQTVPSGSWKFRAKILRYMDNQLSRAFLMAVEDASNEVRAVGSHQTHNVETTYHNAPSQQVFVWGSTGQTFSDLWAELEWNGTNLIGRYSTDGVHFHQLATLTPAYTPTLIGLGVQNITGTLQLYRFDWFRRVA